MEDRIEGRNSEAAARQKVDREATAIGVDIGGTNLRAAVVDTDGRVSHEVSLPTMAEQGVETVLGQIREAISQVLAESEYKVSGIGVGCPGLVDPRRGIVRDSPNLRGWDEVPLGDEIHEAFGVPTVVANDVNAMAVGEFQHGAGRGFRDLICLTLGTGVGGAFIADGRLYTGFLGTAGEIGHITVEPNGPQCNCGNRGCLESLIGAAAIVERTVMRLRDSEARSHLSDYDRSTLTPKLIAQAAQRGDELAAEVLGQVGEYLGIVLAGLVNFLNPQTIIIGGGVARAGELIFGPVRETVKRRAFALPAEKVRILPAELGGEAGVIGAATLVFLNQR
ncbi:MAG: ROK family protein [bacterium]